MTYLKLLKVPKSDLWNLVLKADTERVVFYRLTRVQGDRLVDLIGDLKSWERDWEDLKMDRDFLLTILEVWKRVMESE